MPAAPTHHPVTFSHVLFPAPQRSAAYDKEGTQRDVDAAMRVAEAFSARF